MARSILSDARLKRPATQDDLAALQKISVDDNSDRRFSGRRREAEDVTNSTSS